MTDSRRTAGELLHFPGDYTFKAFGETAPAGEFVAAVQRAARQIAPSGQDVSLQVRPSSGGRYLCATLTVRLENSTQLATSYAILRNLEGLRYLL